MSRALLFFLVTAVSSCLRMEETVSQGYFEENNLISANVYVDEPRRISDVKSSFSSGEMSRLTDLNVFMYHQGKLLREHSGYFEDVSALMLSFPVGKDGFNIYMFGNVGRCEAPAREEEICSLRHVVGEYEEFRTKGVPVAGTFVDYRRGMLADFPLKRLVGQFDIRMRQSSDEACYQIKDIRVMNCALDVYPFSNGQKASMFSRSYQYGQKCLGDMLTGEDVTRLNEGHTVSLYFVENLQGELLPDNMDSKSKIPSSLPAGVAECCTYVEITADVTTQIARYTDARYRFYPGENETTDFTIRRNTLYEIVLDFTQNMVHNQEWMIEASYPDVVDVWMDKQEAMVIQGAEDMIYVRAHDNNGNLLDFDVQTLTFSGYVNVEKETVRYADSDCLGLRFTSNVQLSGLYPVGKDPTYLTETVRLSSSETFDGRPLFVKDIPVKIYHKLFPLHVSLEKKVESGPYSIVLRSRNPMGLGVSVSSTYVCDGQSLSTPVVSACNCYHQESGGCISVNTALGTEPGYMGELSSSVRYNNLTSLNLLISGVSDASVKGSGYTVAYPKLNEAASLFTGDNTAAFFGPGSAYRPVQGREFTDDSDCKFTLMIDDVFYSYSISDENPVSFSFNELVPFCMCDRGKTYLNIGNGHCAGYANATGCKNVSLDENNLSKHAAFPFYVANARMSCASMHIVPTGAIGNWNNKTTRGVMIEFLGPGRDLFSETATVPVATNRRHSLEFMIEVWKNLFGKLKTRQYCRSYAGWSYMTINGASAWVGGDDSEYGVSSGDI